MELLKGLALWFGAMVMAIVLMLAICPWIITGSYAEITIDHISVDATGQYGISYHSRLAARTSLSDAFWEGTKNFGGGSSSHGGLLGWPSNGSAGATFDLDPEGRRSLRRPRPERLLVHEGETHILRPGQRLYFYDFTLPNGVRYYGYAEATVYQDRTRVTRPWSLW